MLAALPEILLANVPSKAAQDSQLRGRITHQEGPDTVQGFGLQPGTNPDTAARLKSESARLSLPVTLSPLSPTLPLSAILPKT